MRYYFRCATLRKLIYHLKKVTTLILLVCIFLFTKNGYSQTQPPNIIFILGDDIGYEIPTVNGGHSYQTPNIDKMAEDGMRFTQCHAPLCSPSRFMLLTGKYNFRNYTKWGQMDLSQKTIGNLFRDAGYKTAVYGKWQLGGGGQSIHTLGFDNYCVWNPLEPSEKGLRYKNPVIYQDGKFVKSKLTKNKYGDDIFTDSLLNFIDSNKAVPFFVYFPICIAHAPFGPTPDDSVFAKWNPLKRSDTAYFPSMIKYMDKKVGVIIDKVKSLGIENNTIIIFCTDNGTNGGIYSAFEDTIVKGGKAKTTEFGTHVPLLAYWPGKILPGTVNNDLIDCPDLLPTLAYLANIPIPTSYGTLDGISFAPQLLGGEGTPRDWIFCHFDPQLGSNNVLSFARWVQNKTYKLYDSTSTSGYKFYNIVIDIEEKFPIPDSLLSEAEIIIRQDFLDVFTNIIQGLPGVSNTNVTNVDFSSVEISGNIAFDGGFAITQRGIVWDTIEHPSLVNNFSLNGTGTGVFLTSIIDLKENFTYYARTYATNSAGTVYGPEVSFTTLTKPPPVAKAASAINESGFTANWDVFSGAKNYSLDVSEFPVFSTSINDSLIQGFDSGTVISTDWKISGSITVYSNANKAGKSPPSLQMSISDQKVITPILKGDANSLSFWIKGVGTDANSSLLVEGFNGNSWVIIENISNLPVNGVIKKYSISTSPVLPLHLVQFRFTYNKSIGNIALDDVSINFTIAVPAFLPGYNNLRVNTTSHIVIGLASDKDYYYRVRANSKTGVSANSNVILVTTGALNTLNILKNTNNKSNNATSSKLQTSLLQIEILPNPSKTDFELVLKTNSTLPFQIKVVDINGKTVYAVNGNADQVFKFGLDFEPGVYIVRVLQGKLVKTLKVVKGG